MSEQAAHVSRVTLDHNCIIDLEDDGVAAAPLRALISLSTSGRCCLQVVAIGAAELKRDRTSAQAFTDFQQKLTAIGLGDVGILRPIMYLGLAFLDWCVLADDAMLALEQRIHAILFPSIAYDYRAYCVARGLDAEVTDGEPLARKWRNAKCDVLTLWCHIWYGGDIFVTSDGNFHKATKKPQLIALGAGAILRPAEAVHKLDATSTVSGLGVR